MQVYLDNPATTRVDPRVRDAMLPYLGEEFGNPSSKLHPYGVRALEAVERARAQVASVLGASAREVVFTSGATESNNLAIFGAALKAPAGRRHVITQATEHHAVLDPVAELGRRGFETTVLRPDRDGFVDPEAVRAAITERTLLVSIMAANNEIGAIQPLAEIGAACREAGVILHTDAAQAAGRIPLDVEAMHIDLLSLSAHKFYGPKGTGALYVRRRGRRVALAPLAFGGGQEGGLRPGTLNVPGIAGLGEACRIAQAELAAESQRIARLRQRLLEAIRAGCSDARLNGPSDLERRLPGSLNFSFPAVDPSALLLGLQDIAASSGSACTAGSVEASYVLRAIGVPADLAAASLRLCVGRFNTEEEIEYAARRVVETANRLRLVPR
jgi:cysteine desulfurase